MIFKRIKFKSLTMEIWTTFIMMILIIIIGISLFNFLIIKKIEDDRIFEDLEITQKILLDSEFQGNYFNTKFDFKNFAKLRLINYFVVKKQGDDLVILNGVFKDRKYPPNEKALMQWMASHIDEAEGSDGKFIGKFDNIRTLFLINDFEYYGRSLYIITYRKTPKIYPARYTNYIYIGLGFILIGFIASKIVSRNLAKPFKKLEQYTERIAKKQWSEPLMMDRQDEIGRLAVAMNRMQIALKNADEEENMFLQSISHDLKTPVMVIESYAQAIMDGVFIGNLEETASTIKDEANRLKHKIKQLLYLNSLNYIMQNEDVCSEIRVDALLKELYERFMLVRTDIHWDIELEEIVIKGNMEKLRVAFENILDNQIRYAETTISIKASKEDNRIVVEIYNDGPQIREESIKNIFDNFYKDKKGNFGLGLAICKRIVDFHKGNIFVLNRNKGVSFIIQLLI